MEQGQARRILGQEQELQGITEHILERQGMVMMEDATVVAREATLSETAQ